MSVRDLNRAGVGLLGLAAGLAFASPASAQDADRCSAMMRLDLSGNLDAAISLTDANLVAATADTPEYCRARGIAGATIGIEASLPSANWNGKFVQVGCAGFCGRVMGWYCRDALARGYACIASDMGHRSASANPGAASLSGQWAFGNERGQIDHAMRGVHVTALAGKALVNAYYGTAPRRSYFNGCSEGGREALIAAQRFPYDFDGIVAGAPLIDAGTTFLSQIWNSRKLRDDAGQWMLSADAARRINEAVVRQCDGNDGVADGVIGNPRACRFDPATIACTGESDDGQCIAPALARGIAAVIDGPRDSRGRPIGHGGLSPAINWTRLATPGLPNRSVPESYGEEYFRYIGFDPAPGPQWSIGDFDFDRDPQRLGISDTLMSPTNPDLRRFRDAGGKLVLFHGWDDYLISPFGTVDYFETVERTMGGREQTAEFARLFMVPGMDHCALGNGAWAVDFLDAIDQWSDAGQAPDRLNSVQPILPADPAQAFQRIGRYPVPADQIRFSRPVFPWPLEARYRRGDVRNADSFQPHQQR